MGFEEEAPAGAHPTPHIRSRVWGSLAAFTPQTLAPFELLWFALLEIRLQDSPGGGLRSGHTGGTRDEFLPPRAGHVRAVGGPLHQRWKK